MSRTRVAAVAVVLVTITVSAGAAGAARTTRAGAHPLDRQSWFRATPSTHPSARARAATAYDRARERTVLFGGTKQPPTGNLGDTWLFDGATRNWSRAHPATSPSPREAAVAAYDAKRRVVVLFGGRSGSTLLDDTWTWDGSDWTEQHPATAPPASVHNAIAYDARRERVVLFRDDGSTWLWDGNDWAHASTPVSPGARDLPAMTYDRQSKTVVLFGGERPTGEKLNDTWKWDGTSWSPAPDVFSAPPARSAAAMTYDGDLDALVMVGGIGAGNPCSSFWLLSDMWTWSSGSWTQWRTASYPTPVRSDTQIAYDGVNHQVVMFGGYGYDRVLGDTWLLEHGNVTYREGLWTAASDGAVFTTGRAPFLGSAGGQHLNRPIVGIAGTTAGYYLVASDGGIFAYGNARYHGSTGGQHLNRAIVGMAVANGGRGYYLLASDGGIFTFGKAFYRGSAANLPLTHPVVGMATTRAGYWIVTSTGRVLPYGNVRFHGSVPAALHQKIVGIAAVPPPLGSCDSRTTPEGYWVAAANGRVYAFGAAQPFGGAAGSLGKAHIVGITAAPSGDGYWLTASDGRVFSKGLATRYPIEPAATRAPIVGIAGYEHFVVKPR